MGGKFNNKGQVTIFIIIAIVIVASVVGYFMLRDKIGLNSIPKNIEPLYNSFLSCLESDTLVGIDILESQAGYIELPDFEAGSEYMPFSSQLDFLGNPVPYWYYVSGNNIQKEQIPSKNFMEEELGNFIEQEVRDCIFEEYYDQGFEVSLGEPEIEAIIKDNMVEIDLNMDLSVIIGEDSALVREHNIQVTSELGTLYKNARKIYDEEQDSLFLEEYAVDILRLYAPVDGVELTCSPEIWNADEIFDELESAIEINTIALRVGDLNNEEDDYFVIDAGLDSGINTRFLNSKEWANGFEVTPANGNMLIAEPVGNQPGLGIMGFCYTPYHFVYNVRYPVLVQVYSDDLGETFQFPVAVVIQGNMPREALEARAIEIEESELCKYKNTIINVNTYNVDSEPIDADIEFECLNTRCSMGETEFGILKTEFPQCANGYITARAEGYEEKDFLISTINSGDANLDLDKLYEMNIELKLGGRDYNEEAVINFVSDTNSKTVVYPEQKSVELSAGQYEVQVYIYRDSTLRIPATTTEQCVDVPSTGIGGLFGVTKEECFNIDMPEQIVSSALAGGGKQNYYILEDELKGSNIIEINADSLPTPTSIDQLQDNYILLEEQNLGVNFK